MAKKNTDNDIVVQESTGAVKFDGNPTEHTQSADAASTGAVPYEAPGTTEVSHYTEDVVVRAETPGPVTTSVSWLSEAQKKVVTPEETPAAGSSTTAETK